VWTVHVLIKTAIDIGMLACRMEIAVFGYMSRDSKD